eukprot:14287031-Ditylum_brightwellii.AAC.1
MDRFLGELSAKFQAEQPKPQTVPPRARGDGLTEAGKELGSVEKMRSHAQHLWNFLDDLAARDP